MERKTDGADEGPEKVSRRRAVLLVALALLTVALVVTAPTGPER